MDIEFLKSIGKKIYKEILSSKPQFNINALGRGASGDITYPIDKIAEDIIIESFEKAGFNFNVISEERGSKIVKNAEVSLIIDPIDGSKNAISGIPFFSSSIAIAEGDTLKSLTFGYIINLINGDEFYAQRGKGSFFNGQKIKLNSNNKSLIIAFEASSAYSAIKEILPLFEIANRIRCFGSTALDLAYLSLGAISIFVVPNPSRIFDFSAGLLIAEETGAQVKNLRGENLDDLPIDFKTKSTLLVCKNEELMSLALELLNKK